MNQVEEMYQLKNLTESEVLELYDDAFDVWGLNAQVDMVVEELAEAIVAVQKYFKRDYSEQRRVDLASEVADVTIMLKQLQLIIDNHISAPAYFSGKSFATLVEEQIAYKHARARMRVDRALGEVSE